ncbi:hypothetical protein B0H16DRAFT_1903085 [Mycena metata]|uniref:Uncharacterized protein n=1 Tax=Mycena metata TaxID=1033252 RepID=A0AAD7GNV0_9AGAR|nr:hypothetical protein B0H16DRAFT_1903085 [Mycena metata]
MRFSLLFNPIFRVWTLRALLLWTLFLIFGGVLLGNLWILGFTCLGIIFIHNALSIVQWPFRGLAFIDLLLTLLEIAGVSYLIHIAFIGMKGSWFGLSQFDLNLQQLYSAAYAIELFGVTVIAGFRISTIATSPEPFFRQRLAFLGRCTAVHPPYTPTHILLNRSIARPLVRGESRPILFVRACVIWCIGLGVPIFAFYYIVFMPVTTQIYSKYVSPFQLTDVQQWSFPAGNASLFLTPLFPSNGLYDFASDNIELEGGIWTTKNHSNCERKSSIIVRPGMLLQCPYEWAIASNISISLSFPPGMTGVNVVPVQGAMTGPNNRHLLAEWLGNFGSKLDGVPLFGGSNLVGTFTWAHTDMILSTGWSIFSPPTIAVFTANIHGLQQSYLAGGTSDPNHATLTLFQTTPFATKYFVDTADATVLNGIATFGGFWTFLNGGFALFFGANVLYFAFGRRPLSALGLVHVFQRRRLKREWDEDFPTIHTEGGLPGSESAGIVAFIRERLVDLGEDPRENQADQPDDIEGQRTPGADEIHETNTLESLPSVPKFESRDHSETLGTGYVLDC